jgi:hypothetical protein
MDFIRTGCITGNEVSRVRRIPHLEQLAIGLPQRRTDANAPLPCWGPPSGRKHRSTVVPTRVVSRENNSPVSFLALLLANDPAIRQQSRFPTPGSETQKKFGSFGAHLRC